MIRKYIRFVLAATFLVAVASLPAHAWVAAGPRGVAAGAGGSGVAYGRGGGSVAWNNGAGYARGPYGGAAAWNRGGYYRPPVAVVGGGYYGGGYSSGQVAAAGIAGLALGAMAGAAVASANSAPPPGYYQQGSAYPSQMPYGAQVTVLPGLCGSAMVGNIQFYQCGPNWFQPYFGNSSVYYQVVPPPY